MQITVTTDGIRDEQAALSALRDQGLHVMALDLEPVDNDSHWHHFDAEFHILSGTLAFTDTATGQVHQCKAGSRIKVPARSLHAETSHDGYRIALGTSVPAEDFGDPINLPPQGLSD